MVTVTLFLSQPFLGQRTPHCLPLRSEGWVSVVRCTVPPTVQVPAKYTLLDQAHCIASLIGRLPILTAVIYIPKAFTLMDFSKPLINQPNNMAGRLYYKIYMPPLRFVWSHFVSLDLHTPQWKGLGQCWGCRCSGAYQ